MAAIRTITVQTHGSRTRAGAKGSVQSSRFEPGLWWRSGDGDADLVDAGLQADVPGTAAEELSEEATADDEPGFLELLAEMEAGVQSLGQTMTGAASIVQEIGSIYAGTERVRQADARGGGAAARLVIAEQIAVRLTDQATKLEVVSGEYAHTVERIEPGLRFVIERLAEDPQQRSELPDFPAQVEALSAAAQESIEHTLAMKSNVLTLGKASRSLKRVGQRLAPTLTRFADTSSRIAGWRALIDQDSTRLGAISPGVTRLKPRSNRPTASAAAAKDRYHPTISEI